MDDITPDPDAPAAPPATSTVAYPDLSAAFATVKAVSDLGWHYRVEPADLDGRRVHVVTVTATTGDDDA